jgi:hypothetical protein
MGKKDISNENEWMDNLSMKSLYQVALYLDMPEHDREKLCIHVRDRLHQLADTLTFDDYLELKAATASEVIVRCCDLILDIRTKRFK